LKYYKNSIFEKAFPILCPDPSCRKEVTKEDLELVLDQNMILKFDSFTFGHIIQTNPEEYKCCLTPDCEYVFFKKEGDGSYFECPLCKKRYCIRCSVSYHAGINCDDYAHWCVDNVCEENFQKIFLKKEWKKCPECKAWISKRNGCDNIKCRCGTRFCYSCGTTHPCICGATDTTDD